MGRTFEHFGGFWDPHRAPISSLFHQKLGSGREPEKSVKKVGTAVYRLGPRTGLLGTDSAKGLTRPAQAKPGAAYPSRQACPPPRQFMGTWAFFITICYMVPFVAYY